MNKSYFTVLMVFGFLVAGNSNLYAKDYQIGLSPFNNPAAAESQAKSVIGFLVNTLQPGDSAGLYDAYNLKTIAKFQVSNKPAYRHPRVKMNANRKSIGALLQFAKTSRSPQGGSQPSVESAIRLPQFLRFLGENKGGKVKTDVLVFGNAFYDDVKQKGFSMTDAHVPNDFLLLQSRMESPYGTASSKNLLSSFRVHFLHQDENWINDKHEFLVQRLWSLFVKLQGGQMVTFTSDMETLFQRVRDNAPAIEHGYELDTTVSKPEMIRYRFELTQDEELPIYERPVSDTPATPDMAKLAKNVEVGITWTCACDLDLYARHHPGAETLSFLEKSSSEGVYVKDYLTAPSKSINGLENVVFSVPVNMRQLFLAINHFGGNDNAPVDGEIRISIGNKTYAHPFHLDSKANGGKGRNQTLQSGKPANSSWIVIDPLKVLGLSNPDTIARR